ncbi:MAG TPA: class I SAM-dependent methyltransferase [Pseudonocardiaceae bacterium]|nr:class I SAM-dependent methyltransferase [Pseudonocardiaceae bacterium]
MDTGWEWDETLFEGSARHYRRGRPPYAAGLADELAKTLGTTGNGRLLDVGCGPGTLALALAGLFAEAVGVDPDPGMLAVARARPDLPDNVRLVRLRAEELPAGLGEFECATFGQSFHWMRRDQVAATVREMLWPGGAFVQIGEVWPRHAPVLPAPATPYSRIRELIRAYLGPVRRAGNGTLPEGTARNEREVLARQGFLGPEVLAVPTEDVLARDTDDVLAWVYSRSESVGRLFGDRLDEFDRDLRALLREVSPAGRFAEPWPDTEVLIWRTPGG